MLIQGAEQKFIPVNTPLLTGNEKKYLSQCIDTGWISSEGPFVRQFEKMVALSTQRKYAVAVTNGTAALDVAIRALEIGAGDEVILPTFAIISCIGEIIRSGAKPVFIDSDLNTWNMDVDKIENAITAKTKAIIVVHTYGLPVDMDAVMNIAAKFNLKVIEDAAEMMGQSYKNKPCGSFGDISTLSFYSNKNITTGEGGMLLTNSLDLANRCSDLRNLCFHSNPEMRFIHEKLGWNLRMTNLQAALGVAQMERLDWVIERKREIGALYNNAFEKLQNVYLPVQTTDYARNIYWVYGMVLKGSRSSKVIMK